MMPGLRGDLAARFVGPLNQTLEKYGIKTLEQRAMFLGQLAAESRNLSAWNELYNGSSADEYFVRKYWIARDRWDGLAASIPNANGN